MQRRPKCTEDSRGSYVLRPIRAIRSSQSFIRLFSSLKSSLSFKELRAAYTVLPAFAFTSQQPCQVGWTDWSSLVPWQSRVWSQISFQLYVSMILFYDSNPYMAQALRDSFWEGVCVFSLVLLMFLVRQVWKINKLNNTGSAKPV